MRYYLKQVILNQMISIMENHWQQEEPIDISKHQYLQNYIQIQDYLLLTNHALQNTLVCFLFHSILGEELMSLLLHLYTTVILHQTFIWLKHQAWDSPLLIFNNIDLLILDQVLIPHILQWHQLLPKWITYTTHSLHMQIQVETMVLLKQEVSFSIHITFSL